MAQFRRIAEENGSGRVSKAEAAALRDRLRDTADAGAGVFGQLRLLAAPSVVEAAEAVMKATDRYQGFLQRGSSSEDEVAQMLRSLNTAMDTMRADVNPGEHATIGHRLSGWFRRHRQCQSGEQRG